jgi:hypothetical protein
MITTKESHHETYRKTAISVGVIFIIATVLGMLGNIPLMPILDSPDYLIRISANENQMIIGSVLILLSAFASAGIAIGLYPVLKKHHEALALGSVGFRVMEGMLYIVGVVGILSLLTLSQEYVKAGASNASLFQVSGTLLLAIKTWAGQLAVIAFTLGVLMYYYVFYQSKLIPRWLSGWGLIAAASSLAAAVLVIFGQLASFSTVFLVLQFPIFLQEMVLAVWLIVKGFNPSAFASRAAKTVTNELLSAA